MLLCFIYFDGAEINDTTTILATSNIEEVADATMNLTKWLQVFIFLDRNLTKSLVERAERKGYNGIFLRVDAAVVGRRYRAFKNNFFLPPLLTLANFDDFQTSSKLLKEYIAPLKGQNVQ